jgi:hypothetical protein
LQHGNSSAKDIDPDIIARHDRSNINFSANGDPLVKAGRREAGY